MRASLLAVLFLMAFTACTTTKSSHCAAFAVNPPSIAQIDVMTDEEKARALIELKKFERICGVRP